MADNKYGELILEAIDQLRKRKARPDLDRICHMLQRRHGLKSDEVNEQLSKMVNDGIVIKVDYKGNTSYRNAAKWVRTKSLFKTYFNTSDMATAVQEAVDSISHPGEPGSSSTRCASLHDIEKYLLKRDTMCNMNIATLRSALEKEVANGTIRQVRTGEYISLNRKEVDRVQTEGCPKPADDSGGNSKPPVPRKRLKSNDTSTYIVKDSQEDLCCDYCLLSAGANRKGSPEGLLICKDCNVKAHPVCVDYSEETAKKVILSVWQCPDCKICSVCLDCGEEVMLICSVCDKGYHMNCHIPPVTVKPISGMWSCGDCILTSFLKSDESSQTGQNESANTDSSVSASFENIPKEESSMFIFKKCLEDYPDVLPTVDAWTIEEVETFFKCIGFRDEASAFREQEIDGQSLLLMKRSDVLLGLSIKLGPALKIYSHIKKLQGIKPSDVPEIWAPD